MEESPAGRCSSALRGAADALLELDLALISGQELAGLFAELETQRRRLEAVDHVLVAALEDRGLAGEFGQASVPDLLGQLSRIAPAEARARVRAARDLGPRRDLAGVALAPVFARVAAAQREGAISPAHARVISSCLVRIPTAVSLAAAGPAEEEFLVAQARQFDPRQLTVIADRLLATLDPDGAQPRDERQYRNRHFTLGKDRHGAWAPVGCFTDDTAAIWTAILDTLSAPQPGQDGVPDERTPGQRRHDALLEAGHRLLRSGELPDTGGVPTTVLLTLTADELDADAAVIRTGTGDHVSRTAALRLADQCDLFTTVFDRAGAVLCAGRTRRLASPVQRRILTARDGGCCFPGCTRPPSWCEAHHVIPWLLGGATDIDNLVLICGFHHRDFARHCWTIHMINGVPQWLPPAWLDADQQPRRNTAHHLPDTTLLATARQAYQRRGREHDRATDDHTAAPEPPDP